MGEDGAVHTVPGVGEGAVGDGAVVKVELY